MDSWLSEGVIYTHTQFIINCKGCGRRNHQQTYPAPFPATLRSPGPTQAVEDSAHPRAAVHAIGRIKPRPTRPPSQEARVESWVCGPLLDCGSLILVQTLFTHQELLRRGQLGSGLAFSRLPPSSQRMDLHCIPRYSVTDMRNNWLTDAWKLSRWLSGLGGAAPSAVSTSCRKE